MTRKTKGRKKMIKQKKKKKMKKKRRNYKPIIIKKIKDEWLGVRLKNHGGWMHT